MDEALQQLAFGPFLLDRQTGEVWRDDRTVPLTPKASAVLEMLVLHSGQVVSKRALLHAVWPDTVVSEAALTVCIRELRKALGDDAKAPRYIATIHRRGYRFIASVATTATPLSRSRLHVPSSPGEHSPLPGG